MTREWSRCEAHAPLPPGKQTRSAPSPRGIGTCVLMSVIQRQLLLRATEHGASQLFRTERLDGKWRGNAALLWQAPPELLDAQWDVMNQRFHDALDTNTRPTKPACATASRTMSTLFQPAWSGTHSGSQYLPDAHVQVTTWNLKGFNRSELRRNGLSAYSLPINWWPAGSTRQRRRVGTWSPMCSR